MTWSDRRELLTPCVGLDLLAMRWWQLTTDGLHGAGTISWTHHDNAGTCGITFTLEMCELCCLAQLIAQSAVQKQSLHIRLVTAVHTTQSTAYDSTACEISTTSTTAWTGIERPSCTPAHSEGDQKCHDAVFRPLGSSDAHSIVP